MGSGKIMYLIIQQALLSTYCVPAAGRDPEEIASNKENMDLTLLGFIIHRKGKCGAGDYRCDMCREGEGPGAVEVLIGEISSHLGHCDIPAET